MSLQKPESPKTTKRGSYAISLVCFNAEQYVQSCMNSLISQSFCPSECIAYDNHSDDRTLEMIRSYDRLMQIIESENNIGFGCAHNEVIGKTNSDYILVTNQDLVLTRDYCEKLTLFLDEHPDVASVTGKILRVLCLEAIPQNLGIDACGISISQCQRASLTHSGNPTNTCNEVHEVFGVPATCALYRRSALEDCAIDMNGKREYFDGDFFMYKEDTDLAYRFRLRGWKSYCIPDAIAYHIRTAKSSLMVFNRGSEMLKYWSYRNQWYLLIKNLPSSLFWRYGLQIVLFEFAKFFYSLVLEPHSIKAYGDICKKYARMIQKRRFVQSHMTVSVSDMAQWMNTLI